MPGHQIAEPSQHFWRLEYLQSRIFRFEPREATWNGREQWRAWNAPNGGSEIGNPDRAAAFLADSRQPFIGESLQLAPDSNADVFCPKILLERESPPIFVLLGRDA